MEFYPFYADNFILAVGTQYSSTSISISIQPIVHAYMELRQALAVGQAFWADQIQLVWHQRCKMKCQKFSCLSITINFSYSLPLHPFQNNDKQAVKKKAVTKVGTASSLACVYRIIYFAGL